MGFKLNLILGGLLLASITGSGIYIKYLNNQVFTLKANQIVLTDKISEQNESIKNYLNKQKETMIQMEQLEDEKKAAMRSVTELRNKFAKHDLNNLALMKPILIERRVNSASNKVMNKLISLTSQNDEENSPNSN
jgi:hypothetical protein|tara:strand:+ start:1575 stop:1979 length:405 start_codon:yes stop_codon:yes gene_type:complete